MSKSCYGNSGAIASGDRPCDPNADTSACCGIGSVCVNNLYCLTPWGANVPGTCTDQNWGSTGYLNPACPCPARYRSDGSPLNYLDGITTCATGSYVCGANNATGCNAGGALPIIAYGNTAALPSATAALPAYYSSGRVSTASISRPTSATSTFSTMTSSSPVAATSTPISQSRSSSISSSSPTSLSSSSSNSGLDTGAKIGLGVGVGLGVAILALFIAVLVICMRRRKANSVSTTPPEYAAQDNRVDFYSPSSSDKNTTAAYYASSPPQVYEAPSHHEPRELPAPH